MSKKMTKKQSSTKKPRPTKTPTTNNNFSKFMTGGKKTTVPGSEKLCRAWR